jgi:hypothetical protein
MNEIALELPTAPIMRKRIMHRYPSPLMPDRLGSRVIILTVPCVLAGMYPQYCRGTAMPLILPAEILSTAITLGSYFISQEEDAKLLIWETLTETLKYLALLDAVAGAVMDIVDVGIGVGVGARVGVTIGVGVGVTGPVPVGPTTTAHTIATIVITMAGIM